MISHLDKKQLPLLSCVCIYICICNIYICSSPPTRAYLFSYYIDCFNQRGQPSAICYLPKKTMHWRAFSPSPSQSRFPKTLIFLIFFVFYLVFFFLGTPPLPKPNPRQVIQNVRMSILSGVGERW